MIRHLARGVIFAIIAQFTLTLTQASATQAISLEELARKYAPVFQLQHQETYLPSSIEWYVNQVELRYKGKLVQPAGSLHPRLLGEWQPVLGQTLPQSQADSDLALKIPSAHQYQIRAGDLSSAVCYTYPHYINQGKAIDINYIVFYPFNGQAFTKSRFINKVFFYYGVGFHEGDFEHVTVRVSADGSKLLGVYYSAHADEDTWLTKNFPVNSENRLVSYVALNTHANYPYSGTIYRKILTPDWFYKFFHIRKSWTPLIDITDNQGLALDCQKQMNYLDPEHLEEHPWLKYLGRWGSKSSEYYSTSGPSSFSNASWFLDQEDVNSTLNLNMRRLRTNLKPSLDQIELNSR